MSHDTRLVALDRAVNLAATGRIEPDDIAEYAETFYDYLTEDVPASLDDVLLKLTRIEINGGEREPLFIAQASIGIGFTFSDDGQTLRFTVR